MVTTYLGYNVLFFQSLELRYNEVLLYYSYSILCYSLSCCNTSTSAVGNYRVDLTSILEYIVTFSRYTNLIGIIM